MSINVVIILQSTRNLHEGTNQSNLQVTIYFSVNLHCTIKMYFLQNKIAYQHECVLQCKLEREYRSALTLFVLCVF